MRILARMGFVNPSYPLSELTRDVIAGFYRSYDAFGFGFLETGPMLHPQVIPQLLNYLNVTKLPLGLVLFFGPTPRVRRVIRDDRREYPISSR